MSFEQNYKAVYGRDRSYWELKNWSSHYDLLIVGAGFTGLYTALYSKRKRPDWRIAVVDAGDYSRGASSRNAGFVCFGSPSEILSDIEAIGYDATIDLLRSRMIGCEAIKQFAGDSCNLQIEGGTEIYSGSQEELMRRCMDELGEINEMVYAAFGIRNCFSAMDPLELGIKNASGAIHNALEAKVDPVMLIDKLEADVRSLGIDIRMRSEILDYRTSSRTGVEVFTNCGPITATHMAICTNALGRRFLGDTDITTGKNQVYVTQPVPSNIRGTFHMEEGYVYFRGVDNRILIGGGRHLESAEVADGDLTYNEKVKNYLKDVLIEHVVDLKSVTFEFGWMGHIGTSEDKTPIVKSVAPNVYLGVRLGGMGVALASSVAMKIVDLIVSDNA